MAIVSVSLPTALVAEMDGTIASRRYKGRSEFMRAAVRDRLRADLDSSRAGHVHGSVTITYPHGKEGRIADVRHAFHDVVLSLMHTHCEPEVCMDVLIVGGPAGRVAELQDTFERMREVRLSRLVLAT